MARPHGPVHAVAPVGARGHGAQGPVPVPAARGRPVPAVPVRHGAAAPMHGPVHALVAVHPVGALPVPVVPPVPAVVPAVVPVPGLLEPALHAGEAAVGRETHSSFAPPAGPGRGHVAVGSTVVVGVVPGHHSHVDSRNAALPVVVQSRGRSIRERGSDIGGGGDSHRGQCIIEFHGPAVPRPVGLVPQCLTVFASQTLRHLPKFSHRILIVLGVGCQVVVSQGRSQVARAMRAMPR
mmetsp:Transcript_30687/g.69199  ORF Transcript_30687/g.69199 Transcript_30687/m.69199 type:complete len:237 (-) Transcript_30687:70-780(-)